MVSARLAGRAGRDQKQTLLKQIPVQQSPSPVHAPFVGVHVGDVQRLLTQVRPLQQVDVPVPVHVAPAMLHVPALHVPPLQRRPAQQSALVTHAKPDV